MITQSSCPGLQFFSGDSVPGMTLVRLAVSAKTPRRRHSTHRTFAYIYGWQMASRRPQSEM